jgi:glucosamine--fructose-6-phosphate aminotransferase (isomerizing)
VLSVNGFFRLITGRGCFLLSQNKLNLKGDAAMCGIVGYIGDQQAVPILLEGLKKLEYRGYDSAGIAVYKSEEIKMVKCKGRLNALEGKLEGENMAGRLGIGHTRWATHGEPNDVNSHPHVSYSGNIAVVHGYSDAI